MRSKEALVLLEISERTLRRWLRDYELHGIAFILHGNKNPLYLTKEEFDMLLNP